MKDKVNVSVKASTPEELDELLDRMSPEQIEALKERIHAMESEEAKPEEEGAHDRQEAADRKSMQKDRKEPAPRSRDSTRAVLGR